ncbi:MAG: hypothetical protein KBD21_02530 [Candidatus Pacebacteria bacterium]|nr:hypothetical protein [Candidatus Paceibacterota bacterium]
MSNQIVIRITRHDLDEDRAAYLRAVYGDDVAVVTEDIRYGDDPVAEVRALVERVEATEGGKVVAVEAQAPFPVLMRLVDQARRQLGVPLIRAQFARDEGGRAIVTGQDSGGRDLLKFAYYEELERIEFQVRRLGS